MKIEQVTSEVIVYNSMLSKLGFLGQIYSVYFYDSGPRKKFFMGMFREDGRFTPLNLKEIASKRLKSDSAVITPVNEGHLKKATKPVGITHFLFPLQ